MKYQKWLPLWKSTTVVIRAPGLLQQLKYIIAPPGQDQVAPLLNVIDTNSCKTRYIDSGSTIVHEYLKILGEMMSIIEEFARRAIQRHDQRVCHVVPALPIAPCPKILEAVVLDSR